MSPGSSTPAHPVASRSQSATSTPAPAGTAKGATFPGDVSPASRVPSSGATPGADAAGVDANPSLLANPSQRRRMAWRTLLMANARPRTPDRIPAPKPGPVGKIPHAAAPRAGTAGAHQGRTGNRMGLPARGSGPCRPSIPGPGGPVPVRFCVRRLPAPPLSGDAQPPERRLIPGAGRAPRTPTGTRRAGREGQGARPRQAAWRSGHRHRSDHDAVPSTSLRVGASSQTRSLSYTSPTLAPPGHQGACRRVDRRVTGRLLSRVSRASPGGALAATGPGMHPGSPV